MVELDSIAGQLLGTLVHISRSIQFRTAQHDSPVSETVFKLFSSFFGGPRLNILEQDWGRDFAGEANSISY